MSGDGRGRVLRPDDGRLRRGPAHHRWKGDDVGYRAAHLRVEAYRGRADRYRCATCEHRRAAAWSLQPGSARERTCPRLGLRYSPDPADYAPRCHLCHALHDTVHRTGRGLRLAEIAGWILHRLELAGGSIPTAVIYAEARAAGVADDKQLSAARTHFLPDQVTSDRKV